VQKLRVRSVFSTVHIFQGCTIAGLQANLHRLFSDLHSRSVTILFRFVNRLYASALHSCRVLQQPPGYQTTNR